MPERLFLKVTNILSVDKGQFQLFINIRVNFVLYKNTSIHFSDSLYITYPFQDFRREIEDKQATKTNISTLGKQIISSNITHDDSVKQRVQSIEDHWLQLICNLPNNEEALHTAQMELLPSRQALNDVILWMDGVCNVIEEDTGKQIDGLIGLEVLLQKYRVSYQLLWTLLQCSYRFLLIHSECIIFIFILLRALVFICRNVV